MNELNDFQFKVILQCEQEEFNPTKQYCEYLVVMNGVERPLRDILKENIEQQDTIVELQKRIKDLSFVINFQEKEIDSLKALLKENEGLEEAYDILKEDNKRLHQKVQQTEEYLQRKIYECKNHKKMKEIVFGVEEAVGYEKALLQFQKGLKRRLNDE